jgi:hypothetical protein
MSLRHGLISEEDWTSPLNASPTAMAEECENARMPYDESEGSEESPDMDRLFGFLSVKVCFVLQPVLGGQKGLPIIVYFEIVAGNRLSN